MEGIAITSKGMEDITAQEISEITGASCKKLDSCVIFEISDLKQLCLISYKAQSVDKILFLLDSLKADDDMINNAVKKLKESNLEAWLHNKKYNFDCTRQGTHVFSSVDVAKSLRKHLAQFFKEKYNCEHSYENPDTIILACIINDMCYIGIDFSGFDLNKRHYKIFAHGGSLRATIAYAIIRLSGFKEGEVLLDPFIGDGIIVIEAALYSSGFPVNYYSKDKFLFSRFSIFKEGESNRFLSKYDKKPESSSAIYGFGVQFKYVDNTKKNAKIAGVHGILNLSRADIGWLDVKLKEKSVDRIATKIPSIKIRPEKIINEFFYQSRYILKDEGGICLTSFSEELVKKFASDNKFRLVHERKIYSGQQPLTIMVFKKNI